MTETDMAHGAVEFGLLGPFQVLRDDESLALGGRRQRAILALLACEVGHAVSVERLVDGVWGDPAPPGVVTSVQPYVFHLRQVLEPDRPRGTPGSVLVTTPGGYRLDVDPRCIDVTRFEELVVAGDSAAERREPGTAAAAYGSALALWRGDVMEDLADHDFVAPVRARLDELRASTLESRVRAELDLGHHAAVVAELGSLVSQHPLREGLHALRMLALYRTGRQSDALAAYRDLRSVLDAELGIEPSPPLQELNNRMLRQDPALDWRPDRVRGPGRAEPPSVQPPTVTTSPSPVARLTGERHRRLAAVAAAVAVLAGGAALPVTEGPRAAAEVPGNSVSEIDASGSVLGSVPVGTNPIALAPAGGALWVVNAGDDSVSEVDPSTHAVRQQVAVGHDPRALAVTGDDVWVTNFADGTVSRINIPARAVVDEVVVGSGPDAIAAGPAGLWVANSNDNTIQRIDSKTGVAGEPVNVGDGPDGLAVDEASVWVANGREGTVMQIDAVARVKMLPPVQVGAGPRGIARAGDDVWVADELSQSVTRIDAATGQTESFAVGDGPTALAVLGGSVWVAEKYSGDLVRIDRATAERVHIDIKAAVRALAVVDGRLWVASGAFASTSHLGGTLRVAAGALPGNDEAGLDPARNYDVWTFQALRVVYDGLVGFHYAGADPQVLVPDLATSLPEPTDGDRTYIFNLRPGIRYSTGAEVLASDIELGVRRALQPSAARPDFYWGIVGGKECTEHPGSCDLSQGVDVDNASGRVTFHLVAPDPTFLYKLSLFVVPTPPDTPLGTLTTPLPGTGPYQVATYRRKKAFALNRNPYFGQWSAPAQPAGFVDAITWLKVPDAREAADSVEEGRADLAELNNAGGPDPNSLATLVGELKVAAPTRLDWSVRQGTSYLVLNSSIPPFDDRRARRAFNYAIDRRKVVKFLGGPTLALSTCQVMPPSVRSYQSYCPYTLGPPDGPYRGPDLARARALVQRSGTRGKEVIVGDLDRQPSLDSYYADVLRSLGYRVRLRLLPVSDRSQDFLDDPGNGVHVQSGIFLADYPLPSNIYSIVACETGNVASPFNYCNRELDEKAAEATQLFQTDAGEALRAWAAIDRALTDDAPMVPLANFVLWWLTSERVGNYQNGTETIGPLLSQMWVQ